MSEWNYERAFSRNLGLVSPAEQERLRGSCVAIAGLGGVGGVHLATLLRMGVGRFKLADLDRFELANTNRQYGATTRTLGRDKLEVMAEVARSINPDVELELFPEGIGPGNIARFLSGADVALDGIDFFALPIRRMFFAEARARGVPAVTSAPLGFGATLQVFAPGGMSFDEYFDVRDETPRLDQIVAFAVGLAPRALHLPYMDLGRVDLGAETGPSSSIGCQLAAGIASAAVVDLLLGRRVEAAPAFLQFDARRGRLARGRVRFGNRSPLQRLKRWYVKRLLTKGAPSPKGAPSLDGAPSREGAPPEGAAAPAGASSAKGAQEAARAA